jgi:anti-anti-sigma factor
MAEFIRIQSEPAVNIVEMSMPEYIDTSEFDKLNESLMALFDGKRPKNWILDLSEVTYMGSAMLGMMVNFRQRVLAGKGKMVLCCVSPRLLEIIRTCCMDRLFPIAKSRTEAIKLSK